MRVLMQCALALTVCFATAGQENAFINFETPPVHPATLSPDLSTLAVCNLPDNRIELFDVRSGAPVPLGDIPVGLDPVSLRFRTTNELWVVNHISASINVIDVAHRRIIATFDTLAGPADVAFGGPAQRAFVSCARMNTVQIFDATTHAMVTNIVMDGDRPKAMAVSPDGAKVYVAIFESGNASTILAPRITSLLDFPEPAAVEDPNGPYHGQNPPPNNGSALSPPINSNIPTNEFPPQVSHIVKKNAASRWMDDNNGDWTAYVSGTNSALSGRVEGWDMPDRDLAVIDTQTFSVSYVSGLMNLCMDVAVNPASGTIAVVGTDATNEKRFESKLQARFLRVNLALIDPVSLQKTVKDLNPHLDYMTNSIPQSERDKSLGDPRGIIWNSTGTRAYVSGMGSRNLVVIDASGSRVQPSPIDVGDGPVGLALDEKRARLYVLNRFSASISVVDTLSSAVLTNVAFFDPTPAPIRLGRKHFYDTRQNSGLGHTACASCHPDARMDRLAWDLGDPSADFLRITNIDRNSNILGRTYHPMKGPMVTQTLQDIIGHEPFHWRGDREGIEDFNPTFPNLLGRDALLSTNEMADFKSFLASIFFPPNQYRNLDDTLPTSVPLPGLYGADDPDLPLVVGDALEGRDVFLNSDGSDTTRCVFCHKLPTGLAFDNLAIPPGSRGNHHISLSNQPRSFQLPFKIPQLRNLSEKVGADFRRPSRAGFGFTHDGRVDTLSEFFARSFPDRATNDGERADLIAFFFCLSGPDPALRLELEKQEGVAAAVAGQPIATAVGKQLTLTSSNKTPMLLTFLALAASATNELDLVVRGEGGGLPRGWCFEGKFVSDRQGEELSCEQLLALASTNNPLTFTLVPRGSGRRIGIDRDNDGWFDRTEIEAGFNPLDAASHGSNTPPFLTLSTNLFIEHSGTLIAFNAHALDSNVPAQVVTYSLVAPPDTNASIDPLTGQFQWLLPRDLEDRRAMRIFVRATDSAWPFLSDTRSLKIEAVPFLIRLVEHIDGGFYIHWDSVPHKGYRFQSKTNGIDAPWVDAPWEVFAYGYETALWDFEASTNSPQRFIRVKLEPGLEP